MTLRDMVLQLKYGELSNVAIKDNNEAIVTLYNAAMIELYDRFHLSSKNYVIDLSENIVTYDLPSDLATIIAVYDEDGDEFVLDDETNAFSVFQPTPFELQVPNPSDGASIAVVYKAMPAYVTYTDDSTLDTVIKIPASLLEPLLYYIGYKAHSALNASIKEENNAYYLRYEASAKKIEKRGSIRTSLPPQHLNGNEGISETNTDMY